MAFNSGIMSQFDYGASVLMIVTIFVFMIPIFILFPPTPASHSDALRQTHSKLGLDPRSSNLRHQFADKHLPHPGKQPRIESLYIYPVKSCRGIEIQKSKLLSTGLEHDRLYMFAQLKPRLKSKSVASVGIDAPQSSWEFVTLRQLPLLATVKTDIWLPDPCKTSRLLGNLKGGFVIMRFPCQRKGVPGLMELIITKLSRGFDAIPEKEIILPLEFPSERDIDARGYIFANIKIWDDETNALNMSRDLPPELASYLGAKRQLALFRSDPVRPRKVFQSALEAETVGYQPVIDFHDAHPIHLINLTSIRALESRIRKDNSIQQLDVRRFRGNIIVSGIGEYEEDEWKTVQFKHARSTEKSSTCHVSCRTVRCKLPNVDPATGIRHRVEPDHALRKYRNVDEGSPKKGYLGIQLCPIFPSTDVSNKQESMLEVGMEVDIVQRDLM